MSENISEKNRPTHIPVLLNEVVDLLDPKRGGWFIDGTLGLGGHSAALLKVNPKIELFGLDRDEEALLFAHTRLGEAIEYYHMNFSEMGWEFRRRTSQAAGILLDIGVSSYQIDDPERGFSYQNDGPLDMRMDLSQQLTASEVVNRYPQNKLADILFLYGEERLSRKIARVICEDRQKTKFTSTKQLADLCWRMYPPGARHKHPHPATRTFQALRIEVNGELDDLSRGIEGAMTLLAPGGILAVISFHSLEDRIVKHAFRAAASTGDFEVLTKKPIEAGEEEIAANPRSRSAKQRGLKKL